jgi:DNA invertase Pin-like site-specific DNA recombinase
LPPSSARCEKERALISERTKVALQAARERGVRLGNQKQADANKAAAAARDFNLRPILEAMLERPYRDIAQELTDRGIRTPRGGNVWNQVTVMRVMKRLGIADQ